MLVVHNETSTGVVHEVAALRRAIDAAAAPGLFLVDTISSLARSISAWTNGASTSSSPARKKGLMLPTGMAFTGVSAKALAAAAEAKLPRVYWDWRRLGRRPRRRVWNGTVPVHFFYGLQEALRMLEEEGLDNVFARHHRLAEATRRAVRAWRQNDGPEIFAVDPRAQSDSITAVLVPEGYDADKVRQVCLDKFNVSLGGGLGPLQGRVFRIGHLGDLNEPMVLGAIAAVEMALELDRRAAWPRRRPGGDGLPHQRGVTRVLAVPSAVDPSPVAQGSAEALCAAAVPDCRFARMTAWRGDTRVGMRRRGRRRSISRPVGHRRCRRGC